MSGRTRQSSVVGTAFAAALLVLAMMLVPASLAGSTAPCSLGSSVYVVAHQDDPFLFLAPDLIDDIASGRCVETVFTTAGDSGLGSAYWMGREQGAEAAYAEMAGVADAWTSADAGIPGHPMPRVTLTGKPTVSLVFMRLPNGDQDGNGFASTGYQTLQKLWQGTITTLPAIDGSSSYTKASLTSTLSALIQNAGADRVLTQDFTGTFGDVDHSDHHATAYFTQAAGQQDPTPHTLTGYFDYQTSSMPANLTSSQTAAKEAAWFAYAPYDSRACQTVSACQAGGYAAWWSREYVSASFEQNPPPPPTPAVSGLRPASGPMGTTVSVDVSAFAASHALTVTLGGATAPISSGGTTDSSGSATVTFTVPSVPTGTSTVTVSDGTNSASSATPFTVTPAVSGLTPPASVPAPPVGPLSVSVSGPALALTFQPVTFTAVASADPDGALTDFSWEFDGSSDSSVDTGLASAVSQAFPTPGTHVIDVLVREADGQTASSDTTVEVRPAPPPGTAGVSIDSGDYATNNPIAQLSLIWMPYATGVVVSNDRGFGPADSTPRALAPQISWTLSRTGLPRLPKTVYVRFVGAGADTRTFSDRIVLDQTPPKLTRASLVSGTSTAVAPAAISRPRAGVAPPLQTYGLRITADDHIVGLCAIDASDQRSGGTVTSIADCRHKGILSLSKVVRITSATRPGYARVRNSAGTWSPWLKLT